VFLVPEPITIDGGWADGRPLLGTRHGRGKILLAPNGDLR